jgi:hypothetical protein
LSEAYFEGAKYNSLPGWLPKIDEPKVLEATIKVRVGSTPSYSEYGYILYGEKHELTF